MYREVTAHGGSCGIPHHDVWQHPAGGHPEPWCTALSQLYKAVCQAPKVDLHVHLEGAVCPYEPTRLWNSSVPCCQGVPHHYGQLTKVWMKHLERFRKYSEYLSAVMLFGEHCASAGAIYAETSVSPINPMRNGLPAHEIFSALADGVCLVRDNLKVELRFAIEFYRGADPSLVMDMINAARPFAGTTIVALGASGWEDRGLLADYGELFEAGRELGLTITPHAGEMIARRSMIDALTVNPARIKHGILDAHDDAIMTAVRSANIMLDISILSNLRLGVFSELRLHPLQHLLKRDIKCSLGSDDPAILGSEIAAEYVSAALLGGSPREASIAGIANSSLAGRARVHAEELIEDFDWAECEGAVARVLDFL
jgi:aminodeoxyfutalosine deaminase